MPTKPRSEVFRPGEQAVVHLMNRCVRHAFLMGVDKHSKKDNSHRRGWFEQELVRVARGFAIDLLCYAVMSNHFHVVARSRPDIVALWSDEEVVLHWHELCPIFKDDRGFPRQPTSKDLEAMAKNTKKVKTWRTRLSDFSWYMKLVCQKIAKVCNAEDKQPGKFWDSRFKAKLLLDEPVLLACMAYVDLNRIKAQLCATLAGSDHTAIQRRLQALIIQPALRRMLAENTHSASSPSPITSVVLDDVPADVVEVTSSDPNLAVIGSAGSDCADLGALSSYQVAPVGSPNFGLQSTPATDAPDSHLAPIAIDEQHDPIGPHLSRFQSRCSDKGCLPMTQQQYIELLEWTADRITDRKQSGTSRGKQSITSPTAPPLPDEPPTIFGDLKLDPDVWCKLVNDFGDMFYIAAGMPETVDNHRSCLSNKRFNMPIQSRQLLAN